MHILLISSEELNESNLYTSCFELAQARALKAKGIKVGILSIGSITVKNILRTIVFRGQGKYISEPRLTVLSNRALLKLAARTLIQRIRGKFITRKLIIQDIVVYEALITRVGDFFVNHHVYKTCLKHGMKAVGDYINDHGKPDIIHAHSRFLLANVIASEVKGKYEIPYLVTEHSTFYMHHPPPGELHKNMVYQTITKSNGLITVSDKLAQVMKANLGRDFSYEMIPNIIDEIFEKDLPHNGAFKDQFVLLNVAALNEHKGHHVLLDAFARFVSRQKNAVLRIAGEGIQDEKLKKLAGKLGISAQVEFLGQLTNEQVRNEMLGADCLVVASEFETFGVVVIEAHACGKPVISTKCGGPEEIIDDSNGILVEVNDPEDMALAMEKIYQNKKAYSAESIRSNCIRKFGQEAVATMLINKYNLTLNRNDNNN